MNHNKDLDLLIHIRQQLIQPRYDEGELSGYLVPAPAVVEQLKTLAASGLTESVVLVEGEYILLDKLEDIDRSQPVYTTTKIPVVLYTKNLQQCRYYETVNEFLEDNPYHYPAFLFYIHELHFLSSQSTAPATIEQYREVLQFMELLVFISDYVIDNIGEPKEIVLFAKRKLNMVIQYNQNDLRYIAYLHQLATQLHEAHDKEERKSIFTSELISFLFPFPPHERFSKLLSSLDVVYDNYLKSHLLYVEKFSYHDLKSKVDKDKLEYTKKIYATVNDIQSKMIAAPAAFLLVLAQFDITNPWSFKNIIITVGALLFSILLEVLLRNQFGVLHYVEREILQFKSELSNATTSIDLSEFIRSFAHLQSIANKQRIYLWIFRIIVWLVPLTALVLFFYKK